MPSNKFDPWFKKDIWTHQEAACLLSGLIPNDATLAEFFTYEDNGNPKRLKIIDDYDIFKRADWTSIGCSRCENEQRKPDEYFLLAKSKDIEVDEALSNAYDQHKAETLAASDLSVSASGNGTPTISQKMFNTLKPTIKLIEDFESSKEYKNPNHGGTNTQQQLIEQWLRKKGCTERNASFIKGLITEYYDITTARK